MTPDVRNAKIESTELGGADHYSFWLFLDYGDSGHQGFGGFALGGEFTEFVIRGILKTLEVDSWEKLKGTPVRAIIVDGKITEIGHYLKDQWFTPANFEKRS